MQNGIKPEKQVIYKPIARMKKKELNKEHNHVKIELNKEKKISYYQILAIIILLILAILLAIFSEDDSHIARLIRKLFNQE